MGRAERGVTVKDVAAHCGYAVSTCIDILGGRGGRYSERARAAVLAAGAELGYRRSAAARAMRTGRTNCVALINSTEAEFSVLPGGLLRTLDATLTGAGKHLALAGLPDELLEREGELPRLLAEWFCDGLLVNYQKQVPPAFAGFVDALDLPAVWLNNKRRHDCVHPDDHGGLREATRRLIDLGHRRICYACNLAGAVDARSHYSVADRLAGYREAMAGAGLAADLGVAPGSGYQGPEAAMARAVAILDRDPRPSAVIATDGHLATALLALGRERGLAVPGDLSIVRVGWDDGWALGRRLGLARIPIEAVGERAVAMLFAKGADPRARQRPQAVPFTHHDHDTVGPPR